MKECLMLSGVVFQKIKINKLFLAMLMLIIEYCLIFGKSCRGPNTFNPDQLNRIETINLNQPMKSSTLPLFFCVLLLCISCKHDYKPQAGDILFMDMDCGSFCQAIKKVTYGIDGTHPSHVGVVYINNHEVYVIEADTKGVVKTRMDDLDRKSTR